MRDEGVIGEIYDASYRRLVGQLTALTGSRPEAEEVVQEAFVRALARPGRLAATDNPEAWLRTVAVNLARSRWRRMQRLAGLLPRLVPDDVAVLGPERVAVVEAVRALPQGQREAIALHHFADLPVADVAEALGVPVGTVKARLSRGRAALALSLGAVAPADEEVGHA